MTKTFAIRETGPFGTKMHIVLRGTPFDSTQGSRRAGNLTGSTGDIAGSVSPVWPCLTARRQLVRCCNCTRSEPLNGAWICESLPSIS